jgi:hypothetical protein
MFSLKSLLFAVAIVGLGTAGLIHRTQLWASAMIALTLGMLLFAVCRAWYGAKGSAFWGPFALVGGAYLTIVSLAARGSALQPADNTARGVRVGTDSDPANRFHTVYVSICLWRQRWHRLLPGHRLWSKYVRHIKGGYHSNRWNNALPTGNNIFLQRGTWG